LNAFAERFVGVRQVQVLRPNRATRRETPPSRRPRVHGSTITRNDRTRVWATSSSRRRLPYADRAHYGAVSGSAACSSFTTVRPRNLSAKFFAHNGVGTSFRERPVCIASGHRPWLRAGASERDARGRRANASFVHLTRDRRRRAAAIRIGMDRRAAGRLAGAAPDEGDSTRQLREDNRQGARSSHGIVPHPNGKIYFTAGSAPGQVDSQTHAFEFFRPPPNTGGGIGQDLDTDPQGRLGHHPSWRLSFSIRVQRNGSTSPALQSPMVAPAAWQRTPTATAGWAQFGGDRVGKGNPRPGRSYEVVMRRPWIQHTETTATPQDRQFYESIGALTWGEINMVGSPGTPADGIRRERRRAVGRELPQLNR